jgi:hypothetical protein
MEAAPRAPEAPAADIDQPDQIVVGDLDGF